MRIERVILRILVVLLVATAFGGQRKSEAVAQSRSAVNPSTRDTVNRQSADLKPLYDAHRWFKLRDAVRAGKASAFFRGVVASAFNDVRQAEKELRSFIKSAPDSEQVSDARALLIYLYQRAGQYRRASSEIEEALVAEPDDAGLKNARALFGALSRFPEQSVAEHRPSATRCSIKGGNLFLPVEVNRKPASYIVDTGANFSLISEAEARRLGLTIHQGGGSQVGDSAGAAVDIRLAVAEQLTVGRIRLRNVCFFVVRDDQQPFVDLPSGERGVLGLPVLLALQTLRWKQDGTFEAGFADGSRNALPSNICFEGANLILEGEFRRSKINVFVDTGATRTRALPLFSREFASYVDEYGSKGTDRVTGVGASVEVDAVTLPELALRIGGFDAVLRPAQVLLKDTASGSHHWHVWGGLDLLSQARVVTLDFKSMRLGLE